MSKMRTMKVALCVLLAIALTQANESRIVKLKQGMVKGYKTPENVFTFYGIPYATVPTGQDRFKGPLPAPSWTDTLEAVESKISCIQFDREKNLEGLTFKEDCLVASVYVPDTDAANLPVVFFVHGGAFQYGSGNDNLPLQFVNYQNNIIMVTFNYRVGPHGFLCLGTPDVPGNAGMKDQVAALRWVRENIASFGGNPDDITLVGCSAGGASVDLLTLSKMTEGMYTKAIAQSGSNIGAFAVQVDPTENARYYAKIIGYEGPDNLTDLEKFYKNVPFEQLVSYDLGSTKDVSVVFSACVERDLGIERFLDDSPVNIIKKGNYVRSPLLYGFSNMEGLFRLRNFDEWKNEMNMDFSEFLPADLQFESAEHKKEVAQEIKEFYFGKDPVGDNNILSYIDYHSDVMFVVAIQRAITMQVEAGNKNVYFFVYSYISNQTSAIPYTNVKGATHCTQQRAVLDYDETILAPEDVKMRNIMKELYLNFIHTGEPTPDGKIPESVPKWNPVGADRTPCMELGSPIRVLPGPYTADKQAFWDKIYDRYYRDSIPPYDF